MFSVGSSFVVALDANVLFGYPLRDTLLYAVMVKVVRDQAAALTNPPMTPQEILDALEEVHIRRFARAIRAHL